MRVTAVPITRPFNDLLRRHAKASGPATRQFAIDAAAHVLSVITRIAAREALDTGRYLRAWQEAHNDLGSGPPMPLVTLTAGRYSARFRAVLSRQLAAADARIAEMDAAIGAMENATLLPSPGDKRYNRWAAGLWNSKSEKAYNRFLKLKSRRDKAYKQRDTAAAYLHLLMSAPKGSPIVLIGGRATKNPLATTALARPYARVYGGYSAISRVGRKWVVRSFNREPHARIVEYGMIRRINKQDTGAKAELTIPPHRIVARALAGLRAGGGGGLIVAKTRYLKAVAAARRGR